MWFARSDSLRLIHRSLDGDTIRIIEASHRDRGWTDAESELLDRAEAEAGTPLLPSSPSTRAPSLAPMTRASSEYRWGSSMCPTSCASI